MDIILEKQKWHKQAKNTHMLLFDVKDNRQNKINILKKSNIHQKAKINIHKTFSFRCKIFDPSCVGVSALNARFTLFRALFRHRPSPTLSFFFVHSTTEVEIWKEKKKKKDNLYSHQKVSTRKREREKMTKKARCERKEEGSKGETERKTDIKENDN